MKYKIIIAGPVGAGKTTAINSLTSENSFMTDVAVSDEVTSTRKSNTTVAMDFGVVRIKDDIAHVYGTPGQQRFNFMWEILAEGADGLILLLDNTRNYPYRDLKYFSESFSDLIASQTLIIAVTRSDESNETPLEAYKQWIKELDLKADVSFIDAREKDDVEKVVSALVEQIAHARQQADEQKIVANEIEKNEEVVEKESLQIDSTPEMNIATKASLDDSLSDKRELVVDKENAEAESLYAATDSFNLNEETLLQVATLKDVEGVTLTNSYGELLHSTINDDDINEFIAFLSGITPALEEASSMGRINRIMLRGPLDDNLTIFVEEERSLGVSSNKVVSVPALSQKIEDMLQWV